MAREGDQRPVYGLSLAAMSEWETDLIDEYVMLRAWARNVGIAGGLVGALGAIAGVACIATGSTLVGLLVTAFAAMSLVLAVASQAVARRTPLIDPEAARTAPVSDPAEAFEVGSRVLYALNPRKVMHGSVVHFTHEAANPLVGVRLDSGGLIEVRADALRLDPDAS